MTMSQSTDAGNSGGSDAVDERQSFSFIQRVRIVSAIAAGFLIVWTLAGAMGLPATKGMSISLLGQPSPVVAVVVTAAAFFVALAVAVVVTGSLGIEVPVACAATALIAISRRGGAMRYTLFEATSAGIFIKLAVELVILFVFIVVGWRVAVQLERLGFIKRQPSDPYADDTTAAGIQAMVAHALAMLLVMALLCQTDDKMQAIASVFIAAVLGSLGACGMTRVKSAFWLILGPCIAGVVAYTYTYYHPGQWYIGQVDTYLVMLARPLPIDYASAGVCGAIMGKWLFESWGVEEDDSESKA